MQHPLLGEIGHRRVQPLVRLARQQRDGSRVGSSIAGSLVDSEVIDGLKSCCRSTPSELCPLFSVGDRTSVSRTFASCESMWLSSAR